MVDGSLVINEVLRDLDDIHNVRKTIHKGFMVISIDNLRSTFKLIKEKGSSP